MPDLPRHVIRETGKIRSVRDSKKDRQKRQTNSPGELELADRQLDRKKRITGTDRARQTVSDK